MNLTRFFHHGPTTTVPSFSYSQALYCCTCHLIWDGQRSPQCPQGHTVSITFPELLRQKNEQIVKLRSMVRKLLRLIIKTDSQELSKTIGDLPPAA